MTVNELIGKLGAETLALPRGDAEIKGAYACDLLSWVMGRASYGNAWVTMMTNVNVLAVASLLELSCVILTENVEVQPDFIARAAEKGVNVIRTPDDTYTVCVRLGGMPI